MNRDAPAYGLWPLVIINAAIFITFAFSFAKPRTSRDCRSLGAFSAFVVALFTEMSQFGEKRVFVNVVDGAGWLARRSDLRKIYDGCDFCLKMRTSDQLEAALVHKKVGQTRRDRVSLVYA